MNTQKALPYLEIWLLLSATAFLSLVYLDKEGIWLDEAFSIVFTRLSWGDLWSFYSNVEPNMTAYYCLLKVWVAIFGDSEFAVRSLSAALAVPTVAMTYAIANGQFGRTAALVAGVLLSTNGFFVEYAQEARGYMLTVCLATVSMYVFFLAVERNVVKWYVLLGVTNALVVYSHFFGAFALLAQVGAVLFMPQRLVNWKRLFSSAFISGVLLLPLIGLVLAADINHWPTLESPRIGAFYGAAVKLTGDGLFPVTAAYSLCVMLFVVHAIRSGKPLEGRYVRWQNATLALWLILPTVCLFLLSFVTPAFMTRYLITSLPAISIVAAVGALNLRPRQLRVAAVLLLICGSLYNLYVQYESQDKRDWRPAVALVTENAQEGDGILFYSWVTKYPFEYYYGRQRLKGTESPVLHSVWPSPFSALNSMDDASTYERLAFNYEDPDASSFAELSERHPRLWVVLALDNISGYGWSSDEVLPSIERNFALEREYPLERIRIRLYRSSQQEQLANKGGGISSERAVQAGAKQ